MSGSYVILFDVGGPTALSDPLRAPDLTRRPRGERACYQTATHRSLMGVCSTTRPLLVCLASSEARCHRETWRSGRPISGS